MKNQTIEKYIYVIFTNYHIAHANVIMSVREKKGQRRQLWQERLMIVAAATRVRGWGDGYCLLEYIKLLYRCHLVNKTSPDFSTQFP